LASDIVFRLTGVLGEGGYVNERKDFRERMRNGRDRKARDMRPVGKQVRR